MPGQWFPGVTLNYVDQVLKHTGAAGDGHPGYRRGRHPYRDPVDGVTGPRGRCGRAAAAPRRPAGDCVAAYLPDIAEAMIAFLATAAIGAVWSACGQDYARSGAAARLAQLEPKVLFSCDGYQLNGKRIDKRADTEQLHGLLRVTRTWSCWTVRNTRP